MFVRARMLLVLALATVCLADHELHCPAKYASASCQSFIQHGAALKSLHDVCSQVPFASGCSLHRGCGGTPPPSDICFPTNHLLAICLEFPELDACLELEESCGPLNDIAVCDDITDLKLMSTMDAFEAARSICEEQDVEQCGECRATSANPMTNAGRKRFSNACLDPLGTLSSLCKEMDMIPCRAWHDWCGLETTEGLPDMCRNNEMSHDHHDRQHNHGAMDGMTAETMSNSDDACVTDPTGETCEEYEYPLDMILEDNIALCVTEGSGMPWMPGCSIRGDCMRTDRNDGLCDPFTILATLCEDMPRMSGCRRYNSMCTEGSLVPQCHSKKAIPGAPKTMATQKAIISACASHSMEGCQECPATGARCAHTLETMTKLCFTMPTMPFCEEHRRFCNSTSGYFDRFCDRSTGDYLPPMRMYFHFGQRDIILFKEWIPKSEAGYAGSFIAIVLLGIVLQAIKALRTMLESSWYRSIVTDAQNNGDCVTCVEEGPSCDPACEKPCETKCGTEPMLPSSYQRLGSRFKRNLIRAVLSGLVSCLDLGLMLIAMTFNVGLFIAVVLGIALGVFLFGHVVERDYVQTAVPLSKQTSRRPAMDTMQGCCS